MKALIIGLGSIGVRHLNNLYSLGVRDFSVFRKRMLAPPAEILADHIQIFDDYNKALADSPEIAVISNPTSLHLEYALKAVEAGCHIYIEKPVSHSLEGLDILRKTAKQKKTSIMVGCQLRFHPNLKDIKDWIHAKLLGKIYSVSVDMGEYLPGWHPWEDYKDSYAAKSSLGGGVVLTQIHDIDYLYWLFGSMESVYAIGGQLTPLKVDVEDTALISMKTVSGIPIYLRMDYWRKPPVRKMSIVGEHGEIHWNYYKGNAVLTRNGKIEKQSNIPEKWERNHMFQEIMHNFLNSIKTGAKVKVPLMDGVDVLKIALAAKKSINDTEIIYI